MSTEHQRKLNRERQQKFRDKKSNPIPNAWDYEMPAARVRELDAYAKEVSEKIGLELEALGNNDKYILDGVARSILAIEKNWTQLVQNPQGILAGGYFPDALASHAIKHVLKSRLQESPSFAELYRRFLQVVVRFFDKTDERYLTPEYIVEANQELAGVYVLQESPGGSSHVAEPRMPTDPRMLGLDWKNPQPELSEEEKKELWAARQHNKHYLETKRQMFDSSNIF